jgi:CheY-like chemotaxis protein
MAHPTICVVNDDETYIELIQEMLTDAGYPNVVSHVSAGAFHYIRDTQPDLVLLDINISNPGRGWNTLDALCLYPKTREIPVIVCSTDMHLLNEKAAMLRELNCQILEKPFTLEALLERIAAAMGSPPA